MSAIVKMRSFVFILLFFAFAKNTYAQGYGPFINGMPGTYGAYFNQDVMQGNYRIYLNNGKQIAATGTIRSHKGEVIFKGSSLYGEKLRISPGETSKIGFYINGKLQDFLSFDNKYWLVPAGDSLPNLYYALNFGNIAVIKEGDKLRQLTKDEVLKLVQGHKKAEKFAEKEDYNRAFSEYNGISTSPYRTGKKGEKNKKDD